MSGFDPTVVWAPVMAKKPTRPVLLSGGNPQIPKGDGPAPVRRYIAAMPGWKRGVGRRLDRLIRTSVPRVRKAVRWNSAFYGVGEKGFFLAFHCLTKCVKVAFFRGSCLTPVPPGASRQQDVRYLDIGADTDVDDDVLVDWIRQAAELPGWEP